VRHHGPPSLLLLAVVIVWAAVGCSPNAKGQGPVFGVLEADPHWAVPDAAAGIRLATVNLDWSRWQPHSSGFDRTYVASVQEAVDRYRGAGWQVAVDVGLQSPPGWVLEGPGGRLVDQYGDVSASADFEFSGYVQRVAASYIDAVVRALGPVQYYRVGVGASGETLYPEVQRNGWWAFSAAAQGRSSGLPEGERPTPLPGWIPGTSTYRGHRLSGSQVAGWYRWYMGALVDAVSWEIRSYRSAGFHGRLELVMPGFGATPEAYTYRLQHDLEADPQLDSFSTLNTAAVWWQLLDRLPDRGRTVVDISSVGDASGSPPSNECTPSDARVDYLSDRAVEQWSDTRWLTLLAFRHGLPVMGENPGGTPPSDLPAIFALVRSCHLVALQWAFDFQLHDGRGQTTLDQYEAAIRRYG
jgi:hypothetical protein